MKKLIAIAVLAMIVFPAFSSQALACGMKEKAGSQIDDSSE